MWLYKNGSRLFTELVLPEDLFLGWLVEKPPNYLPSAGAGGGLASRGNLRVLDLPPFSPTPAADGCSPAPRGRGTSACVSVGLASHQPLSPLPPPLFIAFHQHLELEQIRRWLTPSRVTELGETCAAGEGGRDGPPRTLPSGMWGAAASRRGAEDRPGVGKPREHPRSAFPDGGRAAVSSPRGADLGVLCLPPHGVAGRRSRFLAGFRGSFDICHQRSALSLPKSVTEVPLAWGWGGDAGLQ